MTTWYPVVLLLVLAIGICRSDPLSEEQDEDPYTSTDLRTIVSHLAKQVQLQQFSLEERTRADGGSGIKQQRTSVLGSRPYRTQTHTGFQIAAAHDHANNKNTVGLGESIYVLNGVEFRTRHNDYPLYMAHPTSGEYNAVKEIPFPEVPPEVTEKETVEEQVNEMREWFRAWADQHHSERDYRPYFKPVLCFLEAGWTARADQLEGAFYSDRHFIDADSWSELLAKVRYNAYVGRKDNKENLAYLPRTIINITENGLPVYAQWNYRVLCHPLKDDLSTHRLVQEDDLQARLLYKKTLHDFSLMRGARYRVEGEREGSSASMTLLDDLMHQIPGRDNYQGYLTETSFGELYTDPRMNNGTLLNTAYYHRRYNFGQKDASGKTSGKRGYSDPNLFVAETTQPKIAPMYVRMCESRGEEECHETTKRVTYAIPLEIIYLTPLHRWNPYDIDFVDDALSREMTNNGKRNGGFTQDTAFAASGQKLYYQTPAELFVSGDVEQADAADTAIPVVGMLDVEGQVRKVSASGVRMFLPEMQGIGVLRTRYPIMPVHGESSPVWKELNALKEIVLSLKTHQKYLYHGLPTSSSGTTSGTSTGDSAIDEPIPIIRTIVYMILKMDPSTIDGHFHTINITGEQRSQIIAGKAIQVRTSTVNEHFHSVKVSNSGGRFYIVLADGHMPPTKDGHSDRLEWSSLLYSDGTVRVRGEK